MKDMGGEGYSKLRVALFVIKVAGASSEPFCVQCES